MVDLMEVFVTRHLCNVYGWSLGCQVSALCNSQGVLHSLHDRGIYAFWLRERERDSSEGTSLL